jgi:ATP/maltotriose-dependent transcriptional regulator MalT
MNWRGIACRFLVVLFGFTACGPSLLDRWIEIDKAVPGDCPRADALVEEYARAGALPSEVRSVRAHVNALCASEAYTQGNLDQAEARAKRALGDEPENALAQDIRARVEAHRPAGSPPPVPPSP